MGKFSFGIRDRLVITACLAVLATCAVTIYGQYRQERAHVEDTFVAQTTALTARARGAIETGAPDAALTSLLRDASSDSAYGAVASIMAYDAANRLLGETRGAAQGGALARPAAALAEQARAAGAPRTLSIGDLLVVAAPVRSSASSIATIAIAWDLEPALGAVQAGTIRHAATAVVASLLVMLLVMIMLDHGVIGPLKRLQAHAAEIARSGVPLPIDDEKLLRRKDEIGTLARVLNAMIVETARMVRINAAQSAEILRRNAQFDTALANMSQGLCMYDGDGRLVLCKDRFAAIYGVPKASFPKGAGYIEVLEIIRSHGRLQDECVSDMFDEHQAALSRAAPETFTQYLVDDRVVSITQAPMKDGGWVATYEDITERLAAESQIVRMAHFDALTDLPNRVLFRQALEKALARVPQGEQVAVHCLDLDHFKAVNDTLGHPIGDQLLEAVAARLQGCLRDHDMVARLGGDEFAVVQTGVDAAADAARLATRIIERLSAPFEISGHQVVIGASVGIAFAPLDGSEADHLLKCADMAMFRSKVEGRGTYSFFEQGMDARLQLRRLLELDLRAALPRNEFIVHFQPLIDMETNTVGGFEALLRWQHPVRGLVSPDEFIPLAEEIGLINEIGVWVLREACAAAIKWPETIKVAVNLSPVQFKSKTLVEDIVQALAQSGLSPSRLELEITESVLLTNSEATLAILHRFRDIGITIAMDDFGTGYSSLSYLQSFPFDRIKIDRSFVREMQTRPNSAAIIKAISDLGLSLGISTTAEGVETVEQLEQLRESGCSVAQGYLFSHAVPQSQIPALIRLIERANARDSRAA